MAANLVGKTLLNRYYVESFVASGGMGEVYKVWDRQRAVYLAMKVLRTELDEDAPAYRRFQREASAMEKLAHPHIVPFYGLDESEGSFFLLEKFIDGTTLAEVLRSRRGAPLPVNEALVYFQALCSALGYAHTQGIVHCDVKPGNLMVDNGGAVYLTDFGIARFQGATTTTIGPSGTPAYMAPEQIRGEKLTPAVDIYALGIILFEMLTGQRPFKGSESGLEDAGATPSERIRAAHLRLPPPDPRSLHPDLPPALAQVILTALAKEPQARYPAAMALYSEAAWAAGISPAQVPGRFSSPVGAAGESQSTLFVPPLPTGAKPLVRLPESRPGAPSPRSLLLGGVSAAGGLLLLFLAYLLLRGALAPAAPSAPTATGAATAPALLTVPPVQASATQASPPELTSLPEASQPTEPSFTPRPIPTTSALSPEAATQPPPSSSDAGSDGMQLVEIRAGEFMIGAPDPIWDFEGPRHPVTLDTYWIDQTEVTNAMFARFVEHTGYQTDAENAGWGWVYTDTFHRVAGADWRHPSGPRSRLDERDLHPVVQVSWNDAHAYCAWTGKRLPTEAEWEKAAAGGSEREYPWGSGISCSQANYAGCVGDTVPVGSYPGGASPAGVLDMAGNVWEWVADYYAADYYARSPAENPTGPDSGEKRVHRGGSWYDSNLHVRIYYRFGNQPDWTYNSVGFRCAK